MGALVNTEGPAAGLGHGNQLPHDEGVLAGVDGRGRDGGVGEGVNRDRLARMLLAHILQDLDEHVGAPSVSHMARALHGRLRMVPTVGLRCLCCCQAKPICASMRPFRVCRNGCGSDCLPMRKCLMPALTS